MGMFVRAGIAGLALLASTSAVAAPLYIDGGFGVNATTIGFHEVSLSHGEGVADQFAAYGVTFGGKFYASDVFDAYSSLGGFNGRYLTNFSGTPQGLAGDFYEINFDAVTTQAGAYFEFNVSSLAVTMQALLGDTVVETFSYDNLSCCDTTAFLGFSGIAFDTLRFQMGSGALFIMDTLKFNAPMQAVPEPAALGLIGLGLAGIGAVRRRKA